MAPTITAFDLANWHTTTMTQSVVVTSCLTDDWLFVFGGGDANPTGATTTTTSGSTGSWTEVHESFGASQCWYTSARAQVTADGSVTVQVEVTGGTAAWGFMVLRARGSAGIGNTAEDPTQDSTQTLSLTTSAGSAVGFISVDFSTGGVGTDWTPSTSVTLVERSQGGNYTAHGAYWDDQAAGTRSYGSTGAGGTEYKKIAIEILAAAGAAADDTLPMPQLWSRLPLGPWPIPQVLFEPDTGVVADIRAQTGSCSFGAAGSAIAAKVSVQTGPATSAATGSSVDRKLAVETGTGTVAAAGTATEAKVAKQIGTGTAGATGTGLETSANVKAQIGTGTAGATGSATEKKVAAQRGTCSLGALGSATEAKVAKEIGTCTAGATGTRSGVIARAQTGLCGFGSLGTGLGRKVASGHTAACGAAASPRGTQSKRVSSLGHSGAAVASGGAARKASPARGTCTAAISATGLRFVIIPGGTLDVGTRAIADVGTGERRSADLSVATRQTMTVTGG